MSDRTADPSIELVSIRWERVQVIVEARCPPGATIDPDSLVLRLADRGTRFPPTHATMSDARLTLRYNVMNGPGLDPLEPGRWTLTARLSIAPGAIDPRTSTGAFQLTDRLFTVSPIVDTHAGTLSFVV
ncbi:MAG: hypothetical protein ACJ779_01755, partial [Chloroflexota bacterium]